MINSGNTPGNHGLEHGFYFSIYWECHPPQLTFNFFRGIETTNQLMFCQKLRLNSNFYSEGVSQWGSITLGYMRGMLSIESFQGHLLV